jgi:curved DNA-binding protein CbpA
VTQDQVGDNPSQRFTKRLGTVPTYYELLELPSTATIDQVRRAYRLKSKLYHPDTTVLTPEVATQKFRELKEAYGVLNSPERRALYDLGQQSIVSEDFAAKRSPTSPDRRFRVSASAYLDPKERPLSPGEIFAVFLLGATFLVCLVLAIVLGVARGEMVLQTTAPTAHPTGRSAISALKQPAPAPKRSLFSQRPVRPEQRPDLFKRSPFPKPHRPSPT